MMEKIHSNIIKETCLKYVHKSGVTVYMLPMEGVSTAVAQFTAKFGSQDNEFSVNGGGIVKIPDGTAHYLEHKLFESEEKDAFAMFSETGASCNAGTSFDYTQYYFACTDNFSKNLEILLDFVQDPYFTPENVKKERGIIGQEITMYRDNPSWRVFTNLLEGMYHVNPVRLDIAGTVESIAKITPDTLYDCYNAFYNPSNMYLCVAGNFDPDEVARICDECLKDRAPLNVKTSEFTEPPKVNIPRVTLKMPVAKPIFELGFKRAAVSGQAQTDEFIYYNILMDIMFGEMSDFLTDMRIKGLLNTEFSASVFSGRNHNFPFARGESDNPDAILEEMQKTIRAFKETLPSEEEFNCVKRANYGSLVREYSSADSIASTLSDAALDGTSPFTVIDTAASAEYGRMLEFLKDLDENNVCISIVGDVE